MAKRKIARDEFWVCFEGYRCDKPESFALTDPDPNILNPLPLI